MFKFKKGEKMIETIEKIWGRNRSPVGWTLGLILFVLILYGVWLHNWIMIVVFTLCYNIIWFFFPKPKKKNAFIDRIMDAAIDWLRNSSIVEKVVLYLIGFAAFVVFIHGLWEHKLVTTIVSLLVLIIVKLAAFRSAFKSKK